MLFYVSLLGHGFVQVFVWTSDIQRKCISYMVTDIVSKDVSSMNGCSLFLACDLV